MSAGVPDRRRELAVVTAVSSALVLAQAVVFAAFGLALFAMGRDLGWSAADTGMAYMLVVLGACAGAPMPVVLIRRIGASRTIVLGQVVLGCAFVVLWSTASLAQLYVGAGLAGIGFSLSGNTPGVYLVSGWAGDRAPRLIGLYLMVAMLGNALGPPAAQALIAQSGWRAYSAVVVLLCTANAIFCALCLREPPVAELPAGESGGLGRVLRSPIFVLLATSVVASQLCLVTVSSVAPAHLAAQGLTSDFAARLLGIEGIASALATGLLGHFSVRLGPRRMLPALLAACAGGMVILAGSREPMALHAFALLLGAGVGGATLAVTLLLVRYFGPAGGSASLGAIWTLAGLAAIGPWVAGMVADATGGYGPALLGIGIAMVPIAMASLALPRPAGETSSLA
ncbi:CynX/NimT family MFS transporter [Novosphingobium sp. BL-52-GroH]|uniref:MFS transporter n=1 Tax=Novosphingobium sp. BL-52-GroH TaxID=3349877 RepID=UPI003850598A